MFFDVVFEGGVGEGVKHDHEWIKNMKDKKGHEHKKKPCNSETTTST